MTDVKVIGNFNNIGRQRYVENLPKDSSLLSYYGEGKKSNYHVCTKES